jgi:hypothetical protein
MEEKVVVAHHDGHEHEEIHKETAQEAAERGHVATDK